jgi:hypothetical protein
MSADTGKDYDGLLIDDAGYETGTPVAGDYVEVEGDDADGTADAVEIEDQTQPALRRGQ